MHEIIIEVKFEDSSGKRLDVFLCEYTGQTRSLIQQSIRKGLLTINKTVTVKTGYNLEKNDLIEGKLELRPPMNEPIKAENIPLKIVFEDEHLLVINKDAGLIVHPAGNLREGTLVNALLGKYALSNLNDESGFRPGIIHRLDKDTSGLMLVAKTNQAHLSLSKQLADRSLKRTYWALAVGTFKEESGSINAPIGRHPLERKKMAVIQDLRRKSRHAKTHWEVLEQYEKAALLKVNLETGRTHQIRVHLDYIHHPILGDPLYGGKKSKTHLISRQCLHAKEIQFVHPIRDELLSFTSELPADFLQVLKAFNCSMYL